MQAAIDESNMKMTDAVARLMGRQEHGDDDIDDNPAPIQASTDSYSTTHSPDHSSVDQASHQEMTSSDHPSHLPSSQPWQRLDYHPSTHRLRDAVASLQCDDVMWFLDQIDRMNGGPAKRRRQQQLMQQCSSSPNVNGVINVKSNMTSSVDSLPSASATPPPSLATSAVDSIPSDSDSPSSLLSSLPSDALTLPTSSPYLLDSLFSTIVCLRSRLDRLRVRHHRRRIRRESEETGMEMHVLEQLIPLPPMDESHNTNPIDSLPASFAHRARTILHALINASDRVENSEWSHPSSVISYLKLSEIPYPIYKKTQNDENGRSGSIASQTDSNGNGNDIHFSSSSSSSSSPPRRQSLQVGEWLVTDEWMERTRMMRDGGAILDIDQPLSEDNEQDENDEDGEQDDELLRAYLKETEKELDESIVDDRNETRTLDHRHCDALLHPSSPRPPRASSYLFPPFIVGDRDSAERYLQSTYLNLRRMQSAFITDLTKSMEECKRKRVRQDQQLFQRLEEVKNKNDKVASDVKRFESLTQRASDDAAARRSDAAMDEVKAQQLERDRSVALERWYELRREAAALKGEESIKTRNAKLDASYAAARDRLMKLRQTGAAKLGEVESRRHGLHTVNAEFDRYAIQLEAAQSKLNDATKKTTMLQSYVDRFERELKAARKRQAESQQLLIESRASVARRQRVELDIAAKDVDLIFLNQLGGGVSNPFLKIFACMTGAPDPNDPAPEVVWEPLHCHVTELCSPGPNRPTASVINPTWQMIKLDLWTLCKAEYDRYFKVELWDCNASVQQVQDLVRGALIQSQTADSNTQKQQQSNDDDSTLTASYDGNVTTPPTLPQAPPSVRLPSSDSIRYTYIGQSVATLKQIQMAQQRRQRQRESSVSQPEGVLTLPILNEHKWSERKSTGYKNSGHIIINGLTIHDSIS